jgi:hypothetical protein
MHGGQRRRYGLFSRLSAVSALLVGVFVVVAPSLKDSTGADAVPFAGMRPVLSDNFSGSSYSANWAPAPAGPDNQRIGTLSPSMVHLNTATHQVDVSATTGGKTGLDSQLISKKAFLYGVFEITARTDVGSGAGSALWLRTANGSWPPEIDIAEIPDGTRTWASTSVHFSASNLQYAAKSTGNFGNYNTWDLIWTPTSIEITLNGKPLDWTYNGKSLGTPILTDPAAIPHTPMLLDLTMQKGYGKDWYSGVDSPPYHSTPVDSLHVSSVHVYQKPR